MISILYIWRKKSNVSNQICYLFPYIELLALLLQLGKERIPYELFVFPLFLTAVLILFDFSTTPDRYNSLANWALIICIASCILLIKQIIDSNWIQVVLYGGVATIAGIQFVKFFKKVDVGSCSDP